MQQPQRLKLIAPVQVRVLKPFEYNLEPFKKGDIITIEEHFADMLVDSGSVEDVAEDEGLESINRFEVVEVKDSAATKKMNEGLQAAAADTDEPRTVTSPKDTVAVNADAVSNSNTKSTTKGGAQAAAAAGAETSTTATPRP